jgi:hypothetical protein
MDFFLFYSLPGGMLQINDNIISLDILEKKFCCDLPQCLGSCCRYGDAGAPLTEEEVVILDEIIPVIMPYLREEGKAEILSQGTSVTDFEGEKVTPLIGTEECAYTIKSGNIYMCGIEKAWYEGNVKFRKPISCHLFPVRIKQYSDFKAVNYEEWTICMAARNNGTKKGLFVYEFLKDPLIRALGSDTYEQICIAAMELRKRQS